MFIGKRGLIWLAVAALAVAAGLSWRTGIIGRVTGRSGAEEKEEKPLAGYLAPDFSLRTLDGQQVRLSDFRGRVVLLNFWATWCPSCRQEMPVLQKFFDEKGNRVQLLTVDIDEPEKVVRDFMQSNGYSFPVLMDNGEVTSLYRVTAIPTTFFIDARGVIMGKHMGPLDEKTINTLASRASR